MKRLFTLVFAAVFSTVLHARWGTSTLHLRTENYAPFVAWINGWQIHSTSNRISIDEIYPGQYPLKIAVVGRVPGGRASRVIFNDFIRVAPNRVIYAYIDRFGNFVVERSFAKRNSPRFPNNVCSADCYDFIHQNQCYEPHDAPNFSEDCNPFLEPVVCNFQPNWQQSAWNVMDRATFRQLIEAINAASFESARLQVVKQAANHYYFTSAQVAEVLRVFNFESTKLEVAKMLYPQTIDQQNFFNVTREFTFSSSVSELTRYTAQR